MLFLVHSEHNLANIFVLPSSNDNDENVDKGLNEGSHNLDGSSKVKKRKKLSIIPINVRNTSPKLTPAITRNNFYDDFFIDEMDEDKERINFGRSIKKNKTCKEEEDFISMLDSINDNNDVEDHENPKHKNHKKSLSSKSFNSFNQEFDGVNEKGNVNINSSFQFLNSPKNTQNSRRNSINYSNIDNGNGSLIDNSKNTDNLDSQKVEFSIRENNRSNQIKHNSLEMKMNGLNHNDNNEDDKKKRTKSLFFNPANFSDKELVPIIVAVNFDQIELPPSSEKKDDNMFDFSQNHLLISPLDSKSNRNLCTRQVSGDAVITGINFNIDVQNINFNTDSDAYKKTKTKSGELDMFNKISIVSLNNNNTGKDNSKEKKSQSMTINELLQLIKQKNMEVVKESKDSKEITKISAESLDSKKYNPLNLSSEMAKNKKISNASAPVTKKKTKSKKSKYYILLLNYNIIGRISLFSLRIRILLIRWR